MTLLQKWIIMYTAILQNLWLILNKINVKLSIYSIHFFDCYYSTDSSGGSV